MSLEYRSGRWIVVYYPNGRWGRKERLYLPEGITEDEAREIDRIKRASIQDTRAGRPQTREKGLTVNQLFPRYLEWYEVHRAALSYRSVNTTFKVHIGPILGKRVAEHLTADDVLLYKQLRLKQGSAASSLNTELAQVSGFLSWAAREGYITVRQFRIERIPHKRSLPAVLTPEEVILILDNVTPFYRTFIMCLYTMGLRLNEARMLKWDDVDMEGGTVRVKQKGGTWKILPLPRVTAAQISTISPVPGCPYVFASGRTGGPITKIDHVLNMASRKAGIKKRVTAHLFRHSIATHLMGAGVNLRVIQGFLGHARVETTEIYTHVAIGHLTEASDMIDRWSTDKPRIT